MTDLPVLNRAAVGTAPELLTGVGVRLPVGIARDEPTVVLAVRRMGVDALPARPLVFGAHLPDDGLDQCPEHFQPHSLIHQ